MRLLLLCWLLAVFAQDVLHRRIPNVLVWTGAALALLALGLDAQPFGLRWTESLLGGVIAFGTLLCFYILGLMGAGDVKFAGALGLWVGLQPLLPIWIAASLLAGLHALLWLAFRRRPGLSRGAPAPGGRLPRDTPYAAYLAIATLALLAWSHGA